MGGLGLPQGLLLCFSDERKTLEKKNRGEEGIRELGGGLKKGGRV